MKFLLGILVVLLLAATVAIFILARRIERARTALDAKKAAVQNRLREHGGDAELEYVVMEIDRALEGVNGGDQAASADRLRELKTVILKNHAARPTPFDAAGACDDVVEAWRRQVPHEEIVFSRSVDGPIEISGDPDLFRWSLRELFSNVVAHGGPWSRIAVELGSEDGSAFLSFTDDGEGPDLTMISRLYGPFTPRIESEGPGLGLFAVRAIVEKMGGSVKASPGDGGGLRHTVRLPLNPSDRARNRPAEATSRA